MTITPAIVVLCGSTRFQREFAAANREETLNGNVVVAPGVFGHAGDPMTDQQKETLDELHLRKIDLADRVVVVCPGGYIGDSTRREIAYAEAARKPISYRHTAVAPLPAGADPRPRWLATGTDEWLAEQMTARGGRTSLADAARLLGDLHRRLPVVPREAYRALKADRDQLAAELAKVRGHAATAAGLYPGVHRTWQERAAAERDRADKAVTLADDAISEIESYDYAIRGGEVVTEFQDFHDRLAALRGDTGDARGMVVRASDLAPAEPDLRDVVVAEMRRAIDQQFIDNSGEPQRARPDTTTEDTHHA